jgi:peptidoglycan hydrolase CwlO-like protein
MEGYFVKSLTFFILWCLIFNAFNSAFAQNNEEERKALEEQLIKLEKEIAQHELTIENFKKQGKTLNREIKKLNTEIGKINLQIKAINLTLEKLNTEINKNQKELEQTQNKLDFNKEALSRSLQGIYEKERTELVEVLLANPQFSDFFSDIANLIEVQNSLTLTVDRITEVKNELLDIKEELALKKSDVVSLKNYRESQQKNLKTIKTSKNQLLTETKGKESRFQVLLKETKKTAAQIRSQIFKLLGGGELTFEEAYKFAKLAESAIGVRAALILAVLDRESALGQNVGRCNYKTAMHPIRDIPIFLALVAELKINPDSVKVSCPNRDGVYGGAMGPAQFIPSTWEIYKNRTKDITGNNPPSPWRNADAFIATALYLKDAGANKNSSLSEERIAAAKYYAGSRWRNYLWTYGARVISRAQKFQEDIDILNS